MILLVGVSLLYPRLSEAQGSAYAVIDAKTGRLLAGSGEDQQLPIASLTKMWTAVVVADEVDLKEKVKISPVATSQEGSSIYLKNGEEIAVDVLLYGLMLRSG